MLISPNQVLQAAQRSAVPPKSHKPELLIAGATGVLGNAVLRRLSGIGRYAHTQVLACEPMQQSVREISLQLVSNSPKKWPALGKRCDVAVVMFEPPRMFYERERALWTPQPEQLPALAAWLHAQGASTLAVVLPHQQGTLPDALKAGLASLDEHALTTPGFERLLIFRSAEKPANASPTHILERLAHWMLGIFTFMMPTQEQPVRPTKLAEMVDAALQFAPKGIAVLGPQEVWALAQLDSKALVQHLAQRWLQPGR
jgi:hypothetical protein